MEPVGLPDAMDRSQADPRWRPPGRSDAWRFRLSEHARANTFAIIFAASPLHMLLRF